MSGGPTGTATTMRRGDACAHGEDRGAHRGAGGQPVVDEHDDPPAEVRSRSITAEPALLGLELQAGGRHPTLDGSASQPELGDEGLVVHDEPARRDGADGQLGLTGRADLAHGQHVEHGTEASGDGCRDGHAAAGQAEDHHLGPALGDEQLGDRRGQQRPGGGPVGIPRSHVDNGNTSHLKLPM